MTDDRISDEISTEWTGFVAGHPSRTGFHDGLRDRLVALGKRSGFVSSEGEHAVGPVYARHRRSYIDVAWLEDTRDALPRLLLEIDDGSNPRAIKKLLGNPARLRVWLVYGKEETFSAALRRHAGVRAKEIVLWVKPLPFP